MSDKHDVDFIEDGSLPTPKPDFIEEEDDVILPQDTKDLMELRAAVFRRHGGLSDAALDDFVNLVERDERLRRAAIRMEGNRQLAEMELAKRS